MYIEYEVEATNISGPTCRCGHPSNKHDMKITIQVAFPDVKIHTGPREVVYIPKPGKCYEKHGLCYCLEYDPQC